MHLVRFDIERAFIIFFFFFFFYRSQIFFLDTSNDRRNILSSLFYISASFLFIRFFSSWKICTTLRPTVSTLLATRLTDWSFSSIILTTLCEYVLCIYLYIYIFVIIYLFIYLLFLLFSFFLSILRIVSNRSLLSQLLH